MSMLNLPGRPMAKKRTLKKHPSELRWGDKSQRDLKDAADQLRVQVTTLETVADAMVQLDVKTITVDGVTKLQRGIDEIDLFLANLESAVIRAKYRQR